MCVTLANQSQETRKEGQAGRAGRLDEGEIAPNGCVLPFATKLVSLGRKVCDTVGDQAPELSKKGRLGRAGRIRRRQIASKGVCYPLPLLTWELIAFSLPSRRPKVCYRFVLSPFDRALAFSRRQLPLLRNGVCYRLTFGAPHAMEPRQEGQSRQSRQSRKDKIASNGVCYRCPSTFAATDQCVLPLQPASGQTKEQTGRAGELGEGQIASKGVCYPLPLRVHGRRAASVGFTVSAWN